MKILGVDPGLIRLGIGAVELNENEISLITYGLISNPRQADHTWNQNLNAGIQQITNDFPRLLDLVRPHYICAELVPPGRLGSNTDNVIAAITVCKVIAYQFGIEWVDLAANTVKKELTGDGNATKTKVRNKILETFEVVEQRHKTIKQEEKSAGQKMVGLPQDVFDALGVALVGIQIQQGKNDREKVNSS